MSPDTFSLGEAARHARGEVAAVGPADDGEAPIAKLGSDGDYDVVEDDVGSRFSRRRASRAGEVDVETAPTLHVGEDRLERFGHRGVVEAERRQYHKGSAVPVCLDMERHLGRRSPGLVHHLEGFPGVCHRAEVGELVRVVHRSDGLNLPVGAENPVRPAQATIRYSWMRPPRRSALRSLAVSTSLILKQAFPAWSRPLGR